MMDDLDISMQSVSGSPARKSWFRITPFRVVSGIGISLLLYSLMLPATRRGGEAARRMMCTHNLKQIGLALQAYRDVYDSLPPAYTVDEAGRPLHSWRTLILPFLDQKELYAKIDLSKAWNDPANAEVYNTRISTYYCPSTPHAIDPNRDQTVYLAVVTPDSCFRPNEAIHFSQITDGLSQTLGVIEVDPKQAVHWMAPLDADEHVVLGSGADYKGAHPPGGHVLFLDGSVKFLSKTTSAEGWLALISIAGNDRATSY